MRAIIQWIVSDRAKITPGIILEFDRCMACIAALVWDYSRKAGLIETICLC